MTKAELRVLRAQLQAERVRLGEVVRELESLSASLGGREPTTIELMAAGGFLHNLYNGLENCMSRLAHGVDESVPTGNDSQRLLLDQMSQPITLLRPALLDGELAHRVDEYRRFRHAFRHMYYFDLVWERLAPLIGAAPALLTAFEQSIDQLLDQLEG